MKAGNTGHRGNWDSTNRHARSQARSQVVLWSETKSHIFMKV